MENQGYCVWCLKKSESPEAAVYKYNQVEKEGQKLALEMTNHSASVTWQEEFKSVMPEVYQALLKKNNGVWQGTQYYCTKQQYGLFGESLGPFKGDILKAHKEENNRSVPV